MTTVQLQLDLPDSLAREAEIEGLLRPQVIEALLRAELRRRRLDGMFAAADRLAASGDAPLTAAEIDEEIQAVRQARRGAPARGR